MLMTPTCPTALSARVSTDRQVEAQTVGSQLAALRERIAALEQYAQPEADEAIATHDRQLLVGRLDEFAAKVRAGLADADWRLRREIIRALVKQIDVTTEQITVVFRIGSQPLGPRPPLDHLPQCLSRFAVVARQVAQPLDDDAI
jgi:site-specific DNA recombinase